MPLDERVVRAIAEEWRNTLAWDKNLDISNVVNTWTDLLEKAGVSGKDQALQLFQSFTFSWDADYPPRFDHFLRHCKAEIQAQQSRYNPNSDPHDCPLCADTGLLPVPVPIRAGTGQPMPWLSEYDPRKPWYGGQLCEVSVPCSCCRGNDNEVRGDWIDHRDRVLFAWEEDLADEWPGYMVWMGHHMRSSNARYPDVEGNPDLSEKLKGVIAGIRD